MLQFLKVTPGYLMNCDREQMQWFGGDYNLEVSDKSPVVTTRAKSKAQEAAVATSPLPQFEEGGEGDKSDSEDPSKDDAEEGNNDAEEFGDDYNKDEESGEKGNSGEESGDKESAAEESGEQEEGSDPPTTPEARGMVNVIAEDKKEAEWVISKNPIYKASLNFLAKSWWSIFRHRLVPIVNGNVLRADKAALVACIMSEYLLNIF
ncbi:hypothetical protein HAX54_048895 [Datura stramonium]|uniref:Uncharacterized protein n=1 Tax=Datura stramonium TaxID=4076 RepID=A0ABS8SUN3_DATST|nr:hypothetical protein [Datura stramonium]